MRKGGGPFRASIEVVRNRTGPERFGEFGLPILLYYCTHIYLYVVDAHACVCGSSRRPLPVRSCRSVLPRGLAARVRRLSVAPVLSETTGTLYGYRTTTTCMYVLQRARSMAVHTPRGTHRIRGNVLYACMSQTACIAYTCIQVQ